SWSKSESESRSNGVTVSESTYLSVQKRSFVVTANKYEKCVNLKLNPLLFVKDEKLLLPRADYLHTLNPRLNEEELTDALTKSFFICEGTVQTKPLQFTENYYTLSQDVNNANNFDGFNPKNRKFFTVLRSDNDFQRFILMLKGHLKTPEGYDIKEQAQGMTNNLEGLFQKPGAAFPGMYLIQ
ncbi:MAG: hypothetical protein AAGB31_16350, partial [Bdellovibrio sp.]